MKTKFVGPKHYVCHLGNKKRFHKNAQHFLYVENHLDPCDAAVIATDKGKLIAFLRFGKDGRWIWALGTWVDPKYRGQGIGKWLWSLLLKKYPKRRVNVTTMTPRGSQLVESVEESNPNLDLTWTDLSH
jgi:GNAT superfamily N-acetyltransferase